VDKNLQLAAALVIALIALGGNFFVLETENSQVSQNNSALSSQISGLQNSINSLQSTINTLQGQLSQAQKAQSSQSQQITLLKENLTTLQTGLASIITDFNSNRSSNIVFEEAIYSQLAEINNSLRTLTDRLNVLTPQVPISTLVVIKDNYSSLTYTFAINVQNTLNVTVYAQINAVLYGTTTLENCNFVAGSYVSQVYTFPPNSVTVTHLNLAGGLYNGCAGNPVTSLQFYYMVAQDEAVSLTYTFNIVPGYNHS